MILINFIVLILFAIAYLISEKFGIDFIKFIPGILLIFYLPGHNLNTIFFSKREKIEWFTRLPLDIISSITILSLIYLFTKNYMNFIPFRLTALVFITNTILAITSGFFDKSKLKIDDFFSRNRQLLWIISIPIILFVIKLILNPYIFEIDSLLYFDAFNSIIKTGTVVNSHLFSGREAFPFIMMASHYIAGISYIGFFKFLVPLFFYLTSMILFVFLNNQKSKWANWCYLLILGSPMVSVMNEGVRPETFSIAFTIPVLALSYMAIKKNDILLTLLALFYSFVVFRFHESGFILLASTLLLVAVMLIINAKALWKIIMRKPWATVAIVIPYLLLLRAYSTLFTSLFQGGMTSWFLSLIEGGLKGAKWNWWFIDNATTSMGANISWPGISAVLYYLYDGIILLVFTLLAIFLYTKQKKKKNPAFNWLPFLPLIAFFLMHFSFAELLPRLGIILLPNRSWPYIMLATVIAAILFLAEIFKQQLSGKVMKWIFASLTFAVVSGTIGAILGSTFMGAMVLPQEKTAIDTLRELPSNAIIVSPQRNQNLVKIYGQKNFVQLEKDQYNQENFSADVISETIRISAETEKEVMSSILFSEFTLTTFNYNGQKLSEIINNKVVSDNEQKLALLEKYDSQNFNAINNKLNELRSVTNQPIYYLYSFAKLDHGLLSRREWWRESSSAKNYQFFRDFQGQNVIARDNDYVLIKIN